MFSKLTGLDRLSRRRVLQMGGAVAAAPVLGHGIGTAAAAATHTWSMTKPPMAMVPRPV